MPPYYYLFADQVDRCFMDCNDWWQRGIGVLSMVLGAGGLVWPAIGWAGDLQTGSRLSLPELIEEAMQRNPEILKAEKTWEMARARVPQAKALPDPMLQFEWQNIGATQPTIGEMDMSMAGLGVAQTFPYPGKRRLRQAVAEKEAAEMEEMVEAVRLSVVSRLKVAYSELAFVEQSLKVVDQIRKILEDLEEVAQARYRVGEGLQQDILKVQVERSMLNQRSVVLEQRREGLRAMINSLLDRPPQAPLGWPEELGPVRPLPPLEELIRLAKENSPELQSRRRAIEASESQVALREKKYAPDFAVSAGWKSRGRLDDLYQVMVEVELPLQREKRRYGVREAMAAREAAQHEYQAAVEMALAQVRDLATMAATAGRLVELYQQAIVPQTALSLESAIAGYQVGKVDFLMLLDNVRTLLDNQLMIHESLKDYHQAVARLEAVVGVPLEEQDSP